VKRAAIVAASAALALGAVIGLAACGPDVEEQTSATTTEMETKTGGQDRVSY
jgi:hypothetical protein